jgi:hypothetical protein
MLSLEPEKRLMLSMFGPRILRPSSHHMLESVGQDAHPAQHGRRYFFRFFLTSRASRIGSKSLSSAGR